MKKDLIKYIIANSIYGTIGFFLHYVKAKSEFVVLNRGILGCLFIILFCLFKKKKINFKAIKNNLSLLIISGLFLGLNWVFLFQGYNYGVAISSLCNYTAPIFVIIITCLINKVKPNNKQLFCLISAFIGISLISGVFENNSTIDYHCVLYGLLAAVGFIGLVICNRYLKEIEPIEKTIVQLFTSAMVVLPYVLFNHSIPNSLDLRSIVIIIILGFIHTGVAYIFYFDAIYTLDTESIALVGYVEPVLSILIGALIFKEKLSALAIVGTILILGSSIINELKA